MPPSLTFLGQLMERWSMAISVLPAKLGEVKKCQMGMFQGGSVGRDCCWNWCGCHLVVTICSSSKKLQMATESYDSKSNSIGAIALIQEVVTMARMSCGDFSTKNRG